MMAGSVRSRGTRSANRTMLDAVLEDDNAGRGPEEPREPARRARRVVGLGGRDHPIDRLRERPIDEHAWRRLEQGSLGTSTTRRSKTGARTQNHFVLGALAEPRRDRAADGARSDDRDAAAAPRDHAGASVARYAARVGVARALGGLLLFAAAACSKFGAEDPLPDAAPMPEPTTDGGEDAPVDRAVPRGRTVRSSAAAPRARERRWLQRSSLRRRARGLFPDEHRRNEGNGAARHRDRQAAAADGPVRQSGAGGTGVRQLAHERRQSESRRTASPSCSRRNRPGGMGAYNLFLATRAAKSADFVDPHRLDATPGPPTIPSRTSRRTDRSSGSAATEVRTGFRNLPCCPARGPVRLAGARRRTERTRQGEPSRRERRRHDRLLLFHARRRDAGTVWKAERASTSSSLGTPFRVEELVTTYSVQPTWISPDGCRLYIGRGFKPSQMMIATKPR